MNSQVCVNCHNEKAVNSTDNRLVTESCGHIKCMDCLLHEKSGCSACLRVKTVEEMKTEVLCGDDSGPEPRELPIEFEKEGNESLIEIYDEFGKKKKPETSHIRIESDANGRCYVCTVCKKRFHARSQVVYHAYCNGQRKPFQCPECNKSFAAHSHFKYHMRVHRNERTYACDVCGDGFFQMSKLQRHKLKHTKEKKFACAQCSKPFGSLSALRKHELTHSEVRPYACAICSRRFRDSSNYRKHVAKHDDNKKCGCGRGCGACAGGAGGACAAPGAGGAGAGAGAAGARRAHQCPRCPRAFHSRKDMRRHQAVHTDSKPYRCKVCNRRFRRKDNLERHIRNTHPEHVPALAVECDASALPCAASPPRPAPRAAGPLLKSLNPLPPLPDHLMQQHMSEGNENVNQNRQEDEPRAALDKSYILEANNARQSVIVGKCSFERKPPSPQGNEYVHKIRKANSMASQKNIPLPPIDEKKIIELEQKTSLNNLDVGVPSKHVELYQKILYGKSEIHAGEDAKAGVTEMQDEKMWRRKMKLINNKIEREG